MLAGSGASAPPVSSASFERAACWPESLRSLAVSVLVRPVPLRGSRGRRAGRARREADPRSRFSAGQNRAMTVVDLAAGHWLILASSPDASGSR
jgi:hypothetical protein